MRFFKAIACSALILAAGSTVQASEFGSIADLENRLLRAEQEMLEAELQKDKAIVDLWQYRGISGWFKGKEKKALRKVIAENSELIDQAVTRVSGIEREIQAAVYEAGMGFEKKGEYEKALKMYFKVQHKTDEVKYRIAMCHKGLQDYTNAITWVLKMAHSDDNYLVVVDLYQLAGQLKEAINWLFRILEPFEDSNAERRALQLIEEIQYDGQDMDFPNFHEQLSDVYLNKAFMYYSSQFEIAKEAYKKAISLRANGSGKESTISRSIVRYYRDHERDARELLEEKTAEAHEHYQHRLKEVERDIRRAERYFHEELRRAERDYSRAIARSQEDVKRARKRLDMVRQDPNSTEQQNLNAQRAYEDAKKRARHLVANKDYFIDQETSRARRRVRDAKRHYESVMNSRESIIAEYVRIYKQSLSRARRQLEQAEELHAATFE